MSLLDQTANSFCRRVTGAALLCLLLSNCLGCQSLGPNAATGGALGTLAGGVTGAAIGAREGKSPEGALIGAVTGGAVGTIAGNAVDRSVEQDRIDYQVALNQQQQAAIHIDQVVQMTQSGLGNNVIVSQIHSQGIARRPSIDELIYLKNQGVDESVIQAFQNGPVAGQVIANHAVPVHREIIHHRQVPYYHRPSPHYGYDHRRGRHARRSRSGFSVHF